MKPKHPKVCIRLTGEDGNMFFIASRMRKALERAGYIEDGREAFDYVLDAPSYEDALGRVEEWVSTS